MSRNGNANGPGLPQGPGYPSSTRHTLRLTPGRWRVLRARLEAIAQGEANARIYAPRPFIPGRIVSDQLPVEERFATEWSQGIRPLSPGWTPASVRDKLRTDDAPLAIVASARISPLIEDWVISIESPQGDVDPVLFVRASSPWVSAVAMAATLYRPPLPRAAMRPAPEAVFSIEGMGGMMIGTIVEDVAEFVTVAPDGIGMIALSPEDLGAVVRHVALGRSPTIITRALLRAGEVPSGGKAEA